MNKEYLSFNIRLKQEFSISDLLKLGREISVIYSHKTISYEYNTDLVKCIYKEKVFNQFSDFHEFFESNDYRFDMLKIESEKENLFIGFQQSQGDLRVFGSIENRIGFDAIIKLIEEKILYGHIHNSLDMLLSRSNKERSWKRKIGEIPDYIKTYKNPRFEGGERDEFLIDLESMPTHQHLIQTGDKLWFGACTEMYFSEIYYKYIPKNKWNQFQNCLMNKTLDSGLRKIQLYKDFDEFEKIENRKKQWNFRNELNIDEVAHKLIKN